MNHVYFIKPVDLAGPIKIGCSFAPHMRLRTFQVWSPFRLEIIGAIPGPFSEEKFLHDCFCEFHSHHEWFHPAPILIESIKTILDAGNIDPIRASINPVGSIRKWGGIRAISAQRRKHLSFAHRISWARSKLETDDGIWHLPHDIHEIMESSRKGNELPPSDLARLEEVLSDPKKHFSFWRRTIKAESAA